MEKIHFYLFLLLCVGVDGLSSDILQRQKRNWIIDSFRIDEGYTGPFPYSLGTIKVEKSLTLFEIHGQGVDEDPKGILQINNRTGEITVHGPVDYEQYNKIKLVFLALDRDSHIIDTRLGIDISVLDANDHPPIFDHPVYEVTIKESTMQGTALITIRATDDDTGDNKQFDLQIVSSSYESEELEFYITHRAGAQTGTISFKGCLDHEKAEKHIIVIEAKDHGKNRQLSSTCSVIVNIEDGNNHTPVMIGRTGPGKVKEGDTGFLVSRLQAKDDDHHGTAAWRINYAIHGDKNKIYNITTDPVTNEGLLYVTKPLDYEEFPKWNLTITLENEVAYYSCKVESKSSSGPWKVTTITAASAASAFSGAASVGISFEAASTGGSAIGGSTASGGTGGAASSTGWSMRGQTMGFSSYNVIVDVEDVNEAPVFDEPNKVAPLFENTASGQYLVTFTASDPDILTPTTFTYTKGNDPDGWIEVDSKTGKVTTTKMIDRESSFVKQNTYTVLIFASDNGTPAMTSTATLTILVKDENDNVPFINKTVIEMCQSDGPSLYTIEPVDLDDDPYSGPFSFRLSGDVDDRWSIDPLQGYSVDLVKENTVLSGYHELVLEASDAQGNMAVYTLSVTVCSCLNKEKPDCHSRQTITSKAGEGAILIVILSILLLAVMLLLTALVTCKRHFKPVRETIDAQQTLKPSNIEEPGTDCKVTFNNGYTQIKESSKPVKAVPQIPDMTVADTVQYSSIAGNNWCGVTEGTDWKGKISHHGSMRWSNESAMRRKYQQEQYKTWGGRSKYSHIETMVNHEILLQILNKRLYSLQAPGVELCDYSPHVYTEEGEESRNMELDAISISDVPFNPDMNLDIRFSTLASTCMPNASTSGIASGIASASASASTSASASASASATVSQYNVSSSVTQYNASSSVTQYNANAHSPKTYVMQTLQALPVIQYEIHETKLDSPTYKTNL